MLAVPRKGVPPAISQVLTFIARCLVFYHQNARIFGRLLGPCFETVGKGSCSPVETGSASGSGHVDASADEIYLSTEF